MRNYLYLFLILCSFVGGNALAYESPAGVVLSHSVQTLNKFPAFVGKVMVEGMRAGVPKQSDPKARIMLSCINETGGFDYVEKNLPEKIDVDSVKKKLAGRVNKELTQAEIQSIAATLQTPSLKKVYSIINDVPYSQNYLVDINQSLLSAQQSGTLSALDIQEFQNLNVNPVYAKFAQIQMQVYQDFLFDIQDQVKANIESLMTEYSMTQGIEKMKLCVTKTTH